MPFCMRQSNAHNADTWAIKRRIVDSAWTINTFKNRLDKFWSDQDILYDYKADLHGIGNRSVVY